MTDKTTPWWRGQIPTAVLLLIIAVTLIWALVAHIGAAPGVAPLHATKGIALTIVGFFAGLRGGLIGTGGCSVMLPVIHFWMGYPAPIAVGTVLFAVIFTAISGGYGHLLRRNLDVQAVAWLGGAGILGVILGSWLFTLLASHVKLLGLILGLIFLWPAIRMIWEGATAVLAFVVGITTGVAGLGGGYALVPGLIYLFGAPVHLTMGTSLATMIPLTLVGGGIKLAQSFVDLPTGLLLAAGTIVGAQVVAALIKRFRPATLKLIFGLYFLYVAAKFMTTYFGVMIW